MRKWYVSVTRVDQDLSFDLRILKYSNNGFCLLAGWLVLLLFFQAGFLCEVLPVLEFSM